VAVKVQIPAGSFNRSLTGTLASAALRGVDVTVIIGRASSRRAAVAVLHECGATIVIGDDPVVDEVVFVAVDSDGNAEIGSPVAPLSPMSRQLVLDAFNRWTWRGRSL
jgi:hypothetical protein